MKRQENSYTCREVRSALILLAALCMILTLLPAEAGASESAGYRFGTADIHSTQWPGETYRDSYYYTDDWFLEKPEKRNDSLALVSMQLAAAAVTGNTKGAGCTFLKGLGFTKTGISKHFNSKDPDDSCFTWGKKTITSGGTSYTLVAVVIQSYAFDSTTKKKGWVQNFAVNGESTEGEHAAFSLAAEKVIDEIMNLGGSGPVRYWIMGQSRGGAVANLLAKKLPEKQRSAAGGIYAYTFESPATVDKKSAGDSARYGYIHNYLCNDDLVTMVPPWGMTRYGVQHALKTKKTDNKLQQELERLGLNEEKCSTLTPSDLTGELAGNVVTRLLQRIPSRKEYSARQTDTFTDQNGQVITVSYTWQEKLCRLMGVLFGGNFGSVDTDTLTDRLGELYPAAEALAKGVKNNTDSDFWTAACICSRFLPVVVPGLDLTDEDLYVLLKLFGSNLVDPEYQPEGDEYTDTMSYLSPTVILVAAKDSLLLSHQFETVIARLKTLAPEPALENIAVTIPEPAAGDSRSTAPKALEKAIRKTGIPALSVSSAWLESTALRDGHVFNLQVTLRAAGHRIPKKFSFTINGKKATEPLAITRENGVEVIWGTWAFQIGTAGKVTIRFDNYGIGSTPDPVQVDAGSLLKNVLKLEDQGIATDDGKKWQFEGWFDANDVPYENLTAETDLLLLARWTELVDRVDITFSLPEVGKKFKAPAVKKRADYFILNNWYVRDEHWDLLKKAGKQEELVLVFDVVTDPTRGDLRFWCEENEISEQNYLGKVYVNGQSTEAYYMDGAVRVEFTFYPLSAGTGESTKQKPATPISPGASAKNADRLLSSMTLDQDLDGSQYLPLQLKSVKQGENSIRLQWKKVSGAVSYVIYGARCKTGNRLVRLKSIKKNAFTVKEADEKLAKGKYYKFVVTALDKNEKVVSTSRMIHVATKGNKKSGNAASVQISVKENGTYCKKDSVVLKAGGKVRMKAAAVKASGDVSIRKHAVMRFASSDESVATVSPDGVIHAVKKGTCRIYAYAQNGAAKSIKVKVQ